MNGEGDFTMFFGKIDRYADMLRWQANKCDVGKQIKEMTGKQINVA